MLKFNQSSACLVAEAVLMGACLWMLTHREALLLESQQHDTADALLAQACMKQYKYIGDRCTFPFSTLMAAMH